MFFIKKQFSGVDIGSSGTKAVLFERSGKQLHLLSCQAAGNEAEGILNEQELYQEIGCWLKEKGWQEVPACLGIPQYSGSTMLADFPGGSTRAIAKMVRFETHQLAGVSEERFLSSYQVFSASFGRKSPVLIGICNEAAASERLRSFRELAQGNPASTALNGLALLNAFIALEKEKAASTKPILLLDLGQSSSNVVICAASQPLYVGTLSFAAERFNKALENREYQHLDSEGLARLRFINLLEERERSPMFLAARQLEDEIQQAVEHWRSTEKEALAETPIDTVFLCGGASRIGGLQEWLQNKLEVPVRIFGPQWNDAVQPEFVTAYGLGLQAAGCATVNIELLPEPLRLEKKRRQRFPLLIAALGLFMLSFSVLQWQQFLQIGRELRSMKQHTKELAVTGSLTDELESLQKQLIYQQEQLLPLLTAGNKMARLQKAIQALSEACGDKDWFVFLGDETSFFPTHESVAEHSAPSSATSAALFSKTAMPATKNVTASLADEFPQRLLPRDLPPCRYFISAGYTPFVPTQPYEQVRKIARNLQEKGGFTGVDILPERDRVEREDLFLPWQQLFKRLPNAQFRAFVFKMPLDEL
ncbi:MAG: hypothetical protein WCT05_04425 [Lentisphaeria bacterium]